LNYCDANCAFDGWKDTAYDDGYLGTAPVGSYSEGASWCGALDMAGNVWEWVADRYADDYYARSPARNPQGPDTGKFRVQLVAPGLPASGMPVPRAATGTPRPGKTMPWVFAVRRPCARTWLQSKSCLLLPLGQGHSHLRGSRQEVRRGASVSPVAAFVGARAHP
jgi:hypothetical protein